MAVPNIFGTATSAIPLSQLDTNFATPVTIGNTAVQLGNTVTSFGNVTLTNVTISSGNVTVTGANISGTGNVSTLVVTGNATIAGTATTIQGLTVGRGAGAVATNTAVGASALAANTSGASNTAIGSSAMLGMTSGGSNSAFGESALKSTTSANANSAFGSGALLTNTTGANNTSVGQISMFYNTTGGNNTALGVSALQSNTTASNNTAVGYQAGYSNTTGTRNALLGYVAGYSLTGNYCTLIGAGAGYSTTGERNTFVGDYSGNLVTTGTKNTIIGKYDGNQGGLDIRTADNYIVLSDGDGNPRLISDGSGLIGIGSNPVSSGGLTARLFVSTSSGSGICSSATVGSGYRFISNALSEGGTFYHMNIVENGTGRGSITSNGSVTLYNTTSDYRLKENILPMVGALDKVMALKPVTYDWIESKSNGQGFIAHELQAVIPDAVVGIKDAVDSEGNPKYQQIDTSVLVATLTAAIQELKAEFDAYKATHP